MSAASTSLVDVAAQGDRLATLRVLRDDLARQMAGCDAKRDYAALSLRFVDVLAQIAECEKLAPEAKGTPLDELKSRRAAKAAPSSGRATRKRV